MACSSSCSVKLGYPVLRALFLLIITILLLVSLLNGSCSATRTGKMLVVKRELETASSKQIYKLKAQKGIVLNGQAFNYFPKGSPVPPSGPSKRHNSSPQN